MERKLLVYDDAPEMVGSKDSKNNFCPSVQSHILGPVQGYILEDDN